MIDLHRLRLLCELRRRGTVAAVAEALSYSPSTVSHQLGELQREAGAVLFERVGRRLRLTAAGFVLAEHGDALLARMEEAEADVAASAGAVSGLVRVAAFQTAIGLLAPVMARLAAEHPGLRIETQVTEPDYALAMLEDRACDLAICDEFGTGTRRATPGLDFRELRLDPIRVVLPRDHPAAGPPAVRIAALADDAWAAGRPDTSHGRWIEDVCRTQGGFQPDVRHRTSDAMSLLFLVGAGQAVTLLPELARADRDPGVAVAAIDGPPVFRRILTVVREASINHPALAAIRDALRP
ncbi:LysR family transcriptional regulator [Yinghuangia soli]|uniref:LysR family transcriptional regulator n=1 Tax=Yinghuangia soli TaxID=2908204 RepID=A0AA41Q4Z2_9ACTN|nr:LysR family transcriptional regulator [Yinghuangia soli]MCF2531638.1 LysR family transcriptional regulator [Yinghuangia soli]